MSRITHFLHLPEYDGTSVVHDIIPGTSLKCTDSHGYEQSVEVTEDVIQIEHGSFSWNDEMPCLLDISLHVPKGSLIAIVGRVGSGKSSLLAAILGEMKKESGIVCTRGSISLSEQHPWLINDSIRSNIIYSKPYNEEKYREVIKVCCLEKDLSSLPGGDDYMVGDRGMNLSGGQKVRISLARCCYSESDIILLDDSLASIDSQVSFHIFTQCIQQAMKGRTRILVTSSTQYLSLCDKVYLMDKKTLIPQDTINSFLSSITSIDQNSSSTKSGDTIKKAEPEHRATGHVPLSTYWFYLRSFGVLLLIAIVLCYFCSTSFSIASIFLLSSWSDDSLCKNDTLTPECYENTQNYIRFYILFFLGNLVFLILQSILFIPGRFLASSSIHFQLTKTVLGAPISFHDETPAGQILNRFSKDMTTVDFGLPVSVSLFLVYLFQLLGEVVTVTISTNVIMLIVLILSFILYIRIQHAFKIANTDMQRLETVSQSPLLSRYQSILEGSMSIHAFGTLPPFFMEVEDMMLRNIHVTHCLQHMATYLTWRSDLLAAGINTATAIVANLIPAGSITAGRIGVALTSSSGINGILKYLIQQLVATEANMTSADRIYEYIKLVPHESDTESPNTPPANWPTNGEIEFDNVKMRYGSGPLVLNGLSVKIDGNEKIGIVGRTGAGKSSITLALFRLRNIYGGQIRIDGIDTQKIPLRQLRSVLGIVPQDPSLFATSLRFNLDPCGIHKDEELWSVIDRIGLHDRVYTLPRGLDTVLQERGQGFSAGEQELLCISRVLLQHPKIVVLDEATGLLDEGTQSILQNVIQSEFRHSTLITIAHRLNTVLNMDKVCVIVDGKIAEFDSPQKLLSRDSIFHQMMDLFFAVCLTSTIEVRSDLTICVMFVFLS